MMRCAGVVLRTGTRCALGRFVFTNTRDVFFFVPSSLHRNYLLDNLKGFLIYFIYFVVLIDWPGLIDFNYC